MPKNETAKNVKARGSEAAGNFYVSLYREIRRIWRILIIPLNLFYTVSWEYKTISSSTMKKHYQDEIAKKGILPF